MTRRELRLLGILAAQLVTQAVEELHVRLLREPRERGDKCLDAEALVRDYAQVTVVRRT